MLFRKAIRAIWSNKRSYIACVFLIGIGIMLYLAMNIAGEGLDMAMQGFYKDYNFSDVFAKVDAMPVSVADSISGIDGIDSVDARYVLEARVEVPGSDDIIFLRLLPENEDMQQNRLLVTGNQLADENDILVNTSFFDAHGMHIGDSIQIFVEGKAYTYNICGTAMSPEYAYITRGGTDLLPDAGGFGIGYITTDSMAYLTNAAGLANDIVFSLEQGYTFDDVKTPIEDALAPYGLKELIDREDQLSYAFLKMEIQGMRSMASSLPMIFVIMATAVLYLMMKRVIEQDRTQIGTLKALGYSNAQILQHYLSYGGITGAIGALWGFAAGYAMSGFYLQMYLQYFMLPEMSGDFSPMYIVNSFLMAVGGGLAGSFFGALKTLRLSPAEAMRPENPKAIKHDIVGSIKALAYILNSRGSMALRNIARNWVRSGFVVIGVTFAFGLLCIAGSFSSLIDKLIMSQFTDIQRYNVKISLVQPLDYNAAVESAYAIDYVTHAEGLLEVPAELKNKHLKKGTVLTGIEQNSPLYRIADTNSGKRYPPPTDSVILSNVIANQLSAKTGDTIYISSPLLEDDIPIVVSHVVEQNLGSGCYMELSALSALFEQPKTATAIILDTDDLEYLKDYLKGSKNAASIDDKETTLKKYQDMMAMYSSIYLILQIMAALVAFAIIYNTSTIALSERKREYATLRVIGLTVNEVCEIMNFEYWVLGVIAMALGVPFTLVLNMGLQKMMASDLMSMPSTLPPAAYVTGVAGCAIAIVLSGISAKNRISKFDMVEVLKERE